jgi:hypothetical protein
MVSMHVQRHPRLSASPRLVRHERDGASRIVQLVVDGTEPALMAVGSLGDWRAVRKLRANLRRHGKVVVRTSIIRLRSLPAPTSLPAHNRLRPVETIVWARPVTSIPPSTRHGRLTGMRRRSGAAGWSGGPGPWNQRGPGARPP